MKVTFDGGMPLARRIGTVDGYVQVNGHYLGEPNIYAVVVDDKTGTFCALRLYRINARPGDPT